VSLPAATRIGAVRLRVADVDALGDFYERVVGLTLLSRENGVAALGAEGGPALVELAAAPDAPRRPARTTGLFHHAILVPTRADLARALHRVSGAGWRLTGASDHLVSEALYLRDPEGNGIEIYRDRPRDEWTESQGELQMATLPLDIDGVLSETDGSDAERPGVMPEGTRIGHVHLQVSELGPAEAFYEGTLGLDVTVRSYPGAVFLSAGGYHHHLGLNTWETAGAPAPPNGALGLEHYELAVPGRAQRELVRDPDQIGVVLTGAA
jgi:catechol 2,3-dioxygenase